MALVRVQQPTDYVLFEGSQPSVVPDGVSEEKKTLYKYFEFVVTITHWVGVIFVVLDAYFFGTAAGGFQWIHETAFDAMPNAPHVHGLFNYHGFFMTSAFIFFQGEALIIYRVFRHEVKIFSKTLHVVLHLAAIACSSFGLAALIRSKNDTKMPNMYSFHSWLGVTVFSAYIIQFILGFVNYAYPKTQLTVRRWFMPGHRIAGFLIFVMSIITVLVGHQRYACFAFNPQPPYNTRPPHCDWHHTCWKSLDIVFNVSTIFMMIYAVLVCVIIRVDGWIREETPDEKVHTD